MASTFSAELMDGKWLATIFERSKERKKCYMSGATIIKGGDFSGERNGVRVAKVEVDWA